jgi:hypothetical protein
MHKRKSASAPQVFCESAFELILHIKIVCITTPSLLFRNGVFEKEQSKSGYRISHGTNRQRQGPYVKTPFFILECPKVVSYGDPAKFSKLRLSIINTDRR